MRDVIQLVAAISLLASVGLALLFFIPRLHLLGERLVIAGSLIPYGVPLALLALVFLAAGKGRPWALAIVLSVLVVHAVIARPYWPGRGGDPVSTITVMTMNMRCNSPGDDDLIRLMRSNDTDVAVVNGLSERSRVAVSEALADRYSTVAFAPMPDYPVCGTVVLSRLPFDGWVSAQQYPTGYVRDSEFEFALVAVDLPTPTDGVSQWVEAFDDLAADVAAIADRPVMLVGDFNAVLEHDPMRRLLRSTGLKDAVAGSGWGWLPTFPDEGRIPPLVALDHVLVSDGFAAQRAWTAEVPGQQHRALFVTLGPQA